MNTFSLYLALVLVSQIEYRDMKRELELGNFNSDKGGQGRNRNIFKREMIVCPGCFGTLGSSRGQRPPALGAGTQAKPHAFTADWHILTADKDVFSH